MDLTKQCIACGELKHIAKFGRNYARKKAYGYKNKCNKCFYLKHKSAETTPVTSKFDCRFKWKDATEEEKISHTKLTFETNVIKKDGCWEWIGTKDKDGYGYMTFEKKRSNGPRISWLIHNGPIPKGKWILHKCDNPACTNPEHLFLGTAKDNCADAVTKGRRKFRKGEECSFAKLNENKVKEIKNLLILGVTEPKIANRYGVSRGAINDIKRGRNWKHVIID